jgi:hypothetical protein
MDYVVGTKKGKKALKSKKNIREANNTNKIYYSVLRLVKITNRYMSRAIEGILTELVKSRQR